jgi:predicted N-acetyltransferase YhbS
VIAIRDELFSDVPARERLLDACFGEARFAKTSERLRAGRLPSEGLARVAVREDDGRVLGTVRLWDVQAGPGRPALLLGPLAVDPTLQGLGIGSRLMRDALGRATARGHAAVLLVGDAPYYARFGFTPAAAQGLVMPGPCETGRFLGLELREGALADARGLIVPAGRLDPAFAPVPAVAEDARRRVA